MNHNRNISFNKKLIISFGIPLIIFILALSFIVNTIFKSQFERYVDLKNKNAINSSDIDIHNAYINNKWDIEGLRNIGRNLLKRGIILELKDKNKVYIWSTYSDYKDHCEETFSDIKSSMSILHPLWNGELSTYESPIYNNKNKLIGYKTLTYYDGIYYMPDEIQFISNINKILIVVGFISILTILFITVFLSKAISYPIKRVSYVTKLIEKNNYQNLEYTGNIKEISNLIFSINRLSNSLKAQEHIRKRLIADLSHELRTPLTSMHGHLQAIIDGIWEPTEDRLTSIDHELMRIMSLIEQLKNLTKLEGESISIEYVNLKEIIYLLICNLEAIAFKKNITITHELNDISGDFDRDKISQVIMNILTNAIKYTKENGDIKVRLYEDKSNIYISVKDTGIGIPEEDIDYIFERFYRVDKSRNKSNEGLGIGLAISNLIVKEHGGEIKVKSELNKGSEFIIILPKQKG